MTRILCFVAAFLLSSFLDAACDYRSISSAPFRSTAHEVVIDGEQLWVADSYGLVLYDRATEPPTAVSSVRLPGSTTDLVATGGFAYAASGSVLHVISSAGRHLVISSSLDLGATIHDVVYLAPRLYAATSSGVTALSLSSSGSPVLETTLATSSGSALSLAARGNFIYVADGDSTIEVISNGSLPERVGDFPSLPRSLAVSAAGERIFVSNGSQTEVFGEGSSAPLKVGTIPFGTTSVIELSGSAVYTAGADRRVRAIDLSTPDRPVLLFESELPASGGTVNRVEGIAASEGILYAAAGDLGLITFDARRFVEPFPVRHEGIGSFRSATAIGSRLFLAPAAGGLESYNVSENGVLQGIHEWNAGDVTTLYDAAANPARILTSSGAQLTLWDASPAAPIAISTALLGDTIRSAVLSGSIAHAVLSNGSVWRVDLSTNAGTSSNVPVGVSPSLIARGGSAIGLVALGEDGTTTVQIFSAGDLSATPQVAVFEGLATSGIAISPGGGLVAAVTFRGISIADFNASPAVSVLAGSARGPARDLAIEGNDLLILYANELDVWDLDTRTLRSRIPLPAFGTTMATSGGFAFITGDHGVTVVNYAGSSRLPQRLASSGTNAFHRKLIVLPERMYLFGGSVVERRPIQWNGLSGNATNISVELSTIDITAMGSTLFTLTVDGKVSARDLSGTEIAGFQMVEGTDAVALSLTEIAGALHLSLSRGCLSGACEKKTLVLQFNGSSITQSSVYGGALVDAELDGERAFVLVEGPDEIRVLDVRDAPRPALLDSRASEGNPVAISYGNSTIYTLGRRLYAYAEAGIAKVGELLDDYVAEPTGALAYTDQSLGIVGSCSIIAGRTFSPQVFTIRAPAEWDQEESPQMPSAAREVIAVGERVYFLTGHSLEIWTTEPAPSRRRPAG
ncbi:MAG TPA: hypothetical protein VMS12_01105 [Thermoanaerobaculia bacterium]|nr:hypothetical protein [Thermoanaerobaculia bacterium]